MLVVIGVCLLPMCCLALIVIGDGEEATYLELAKGVLDFETQSQAVMAGYLVSQILAERFCLKRPTQACWQLCWQSH